MENLNCMVKREKRSTDKPNDDDDIGARKRIAVNHFIGDPIHTNKKPDIFQLCASTMEHIMTYLPIQDKVQFLSSHPILSREGLTKLTTYCSNCKNCMSGHLHLCTESKERTWNSSTWKNIFKRFGHGIKELHLVGCEGLTMESLLDETVYKMFKSLRVVRLEKCYNLNEDGLKLIATTCNNLYEVGLRDMPLNDYILATLIQNNQHTLRALDLTGSHKLNGSGLVSLSEITSLSLENCHGIKAPQLESILSDCGSLHSLNLRYCHHVNDSVAEVIAVRIPQLVRLSLRYCYKITDDGVKSICSSLHRLQSLDLSQCSRITDATIWTIVKSLNHLEELRLWGCRKLTPHAVVASLTSPCLHFIDIRHDEWNLHGALPSMKATYRNILNEWEQLDQGGLLKRQVVLERGQLTAVQA